MSESPSPRPPTTASAVANGYLDFEKPLARIEQEILELEDAQVETGRDLSDQIKQMRTQLASMTKGVYSHLTPWETVLVARHPRRPLLPHYINMIVKDFCELHGDRGFAEDRAIVTGFGRIGGEKVLLVGHNKGRDTKEKVACNFGCTHPEGYRKALQKMRLAAKYRVPVVCMIDTPGAYPGIGAEERGIAQAIAYNLMEIPKLQTPIVCVVIGEGGSGGALGIGVGDRVAMLEHAYYSVISPEGCAAILWRTGDQAKLAAEALRLTAKELKKLNVIDEVVPEPLGGAHRDPAKMAINLERYLGKTIRELKSIRLPTLLKQRYKRLREVGSFFTESPKPTTEKAKTTGQKKNGKNGGSAGNAIRLPSRIRSNRAKAPTGTGGAP
ncbi:MAG: acetyl-CoA carboxylase carboxyltransferase subunit alpha [Phycisphaerales bacterium]|nr:MAG: acetyl-CoA carboxylase carboxyltransferase subunit alpha [Phycisphaerales bacterium]